ncbi:Ras-related protein Rab-10 [Cucumispora dikerogammari]|nr:Ras-related protein Rab-10 [Cucumispora dikerogammari]
MIDPDIISHKYKILTIGESHVGKTSILQTLSGSSFNVPMSTIGIDVVKKRLKINSKNVLLQIWDTAGQERYESITRSFYRDADAILLVFDLTDLRSFNSVDKWYKKILKETNFNEDKNRKHLPIFLIGNKYDLLNHQTESTKMNMFNGKAKELGLKFYYASAKSGLNINKIFMDITTLLLETKPNNGNEHLNLNTRRRRRRWFCF